MSESMSYMGRSDKDRARDSLDDARKIEQDLLAGLDAAGRELDRLEAVVMTALSPEEAKSVLDHLNGKGEMGLDYLHAREKLKAVAEGP